MHLQSSLVQNIPRPTFRNGAIATLVVALFAASVWYVNTDYGSMPAFGFAVMFFAFFAPMPFIHSALELWSARRKLRDLVLFFNPIKILVLCPIAWAGFGTVTRPR